MARKITSIVANVETVKDIVTDIVLENNAVKNAAANVKTDSKNGTVKTPPANSKTTGSVTIKGKDGHTWLIGREDSKNSKGSDALTASAVKKIIDALAANNYANAVKGFLDIDGAASWYIGQQATTTTTGKPYNRRLTQQFAAAIKNMAYVGQVKPLQFVVYTVPTREKDGVKIVSGTRIVKKF